MTVMSSTAVSTPPIARPVLTPPVRPDNRAANSLRAVRLTPDYTSMAEGSVLIEIGQTRVLCNASLEPGVPAWRRNSGLGWVTAEYGMLPRATLTRTARESERGKISGRTHEIQRLIGRSLRSVVDLSLLGERSIIVDCDVLQADGGTRTAAITGASAALSLALHRLTASGVFKQLPLRQHVAAVSAGYVDGNLLLDLCYEEDSRADVDANIVLTEDGNLVEVQSTAERVAFSRAQFNDLLDLSSAGAKQLFEQLRQLDAAQQPLPAVK
jgi:ribonuclease PH